MSQEVVVPIDELRKSQAVKSVENMTTEAKKQLATTSHGLSKDEIEFLEKLKEPEDKKKNATTSITAGGEAEDEGHTIQPKIQKVPAILRQEHFNKYYVPRAMPVGPINHNSKTLLRSEFKTSLAAKFIKKSGQPMEYLYRVIKDQMGNLKKYFDKEVIKPFDDMRLALMLFSDGCAVMQFIYSCANDELKPFKINNGQAALIQQDLFLLENQIPFRVLKLLIESSHNSPKLEESVNTFIRLNVMAPAKYSQELTIDFKGKNEPVHLLELLRSALLQESVRGEHSQKKDFTKSQEYYKRSFRNIQDLKAAGITLEPSEGCSLRDVSFTALCFGGYLKLPPLIVDDSTGRKLLNLVAFEMCPDKFQTDDGVTSYVNFLDSLIDNEEDAKDLRTANIFRNRLSSDAEVAKIFNEIGTDLVPAPGYVDVKVRIQKHYDNRCMTWVAQVYRDHFSSPWSILALIAAVIALFLTGVQTWFSLPSSR